MDTNKMLFVIIFFGLGLLTVNGVEGGSRESNSQVVGIGVILNLASPVGKMAESYISMAVSDFYAINANYRTRLALSVKDSAGDVVEAASAAVELMNNEQVQAIIGPQTSTEAKFVIDLGDRAQIPIVSFSATSPLLSPTQNPFFIRTAQDDCSQVKALTSIVEAYGWKEVVLIYEDTEYGNGLIPYLTDAFQVINIKVPYRSIISPNSSQFEILKQLNMIMARETRILLVHVSASLGSQVFRLAKQIGMMSEGYAWIITKGLSSLLNLLGKKVFGSMHGVVGVRPFLSNSKRLQDFKTRWNKTSEDINLFGLWAYDTVWALAMAAESVNPTPLVSHNSSINSVEPFGLRKSESGPQLLQKLLHTKFEGLSGKFNLIRGQLEPTDYEIINVRGKLGERVIGNWGLENELSHGLDQSVKVVRKQIIWPGSTKVPPKGWVKPVFGRRLRIGVPITPAGFKEFLKIEWDPHTDEPSFSGFSYDIFVAALDKLPFALPHKFIPFTNSTRQNNGTYDELLYQIKLKSYTASLASMLTVQQLQPAISDIDELRRNDHFVGYLRNSYVKELLTQQLNFSESRIRSYGSPEEYNDAMSKGSKDGGIDAIFEEIPYVKVFLSKYCSKYRVVGPTYKSAGFGFAFPIGSPLVSYISKAILNITQDPNKMQELETKYLEHGTKCEDPESKFSSDDDPTLSVYSFGGLFIVTGTVSFVSYLMHLIKLRCSRPS